MADLKYEPVTHDHKEFLRETMDTPLICRPAIPEQELKIAGND